ncbi:MAG: phosphorylase family protein, partial [Pirellulales bacterium]
ANATQLILQSRQPKSVVSAGFATGLIVEARKGHMVMANEVTNTAGETLAIPFAISEEEAANSKGLHVGRLLTVNKIISKVNQKQELAEKHQAIALDMETAAVAKICAEHQVRFMSVRIITDSLMDQLPRHLEHILKQKKTTSMLGAAASALINNPSSIKEMWNLRDVAMKASDKLARFLTGVVEQLSEPTDQ